MVTATRSIIFDHPSWLYPKQEAAIFNDSRYSWIEASSKSGKTVGCLVWLLEEALGRGLPNRNFWWVAPSYRQADIAFRRMRFMLPRSIYMANKTDRTITLLNGAVLWFLSGEDPDNLYGEDVYACVIDEASRVREDAWIAVRTTLTATRGLLRCIGNVKGRKNWFYQRAKEAEKGEAGSAYHKLTAADAVAAGVLDQEEIDDAERKLPRSVFRELYYAEPADDGGNPFGLMAIRACVMPLSNQTPRYWGWDLAKSVDWTVGIGLDVSGHVAALHRFQKPWQETIAEIKRLYVGGKMLADSTGVGDPIVERLQRLGVPVEGFKFTSSSKQQLMETLAVVIQEQKVGYPEGPIVTELEQFEYQYTRTGVRYSAPDGVHDDCVAALALAVRCRGAGPIADPLKQVVFA